ncbi:phage integrase central domain-containing protein [Paraburkholderia xenovorans]|uniref:phage integrase central domain-containing protein n=1 Tax=Paraburkholderia xenovorans TaxID=36873 RepID=UPI001559B7D0|nr:tyrosine-type recombinase/integrase [Paraburkholderia xenovorans]NPT38531.1 tyrosine-type recombinase/integrase [Paraburkholderia xenovorans]
MAARPRIRRRANWPDNLHEPKPGYFVWRDPIKKKIHALGRVPLAQAMHEAQQANFALAQLAPTKTLADRIREHEQPKETVADLLKKMPTAGVKQSTLDHRKYRDKQIEKVLGAVPCMDLTTKHIADMLEAIEAEGKMQWAVQVRTRLKQVCRRGKALGWMKENPAEDTERAKVTVRRRRMTLDDFNAALAKAPDVAPWLQNAMLLAIVSGQDLSTVAKWERSFNADGYAVLERGKTGVRVAIPLELRLNVVGVSLNDIISRCRATGVVSKYLIHHIRPNVNAPKGSKIKPKTISQKFLDARRLAGITDDAAPTFHEIRSLSKRLYLEQGGVDTKALLGHKSQATADLYADSRGLEPVKVRINVG